MTVPRPVALALLLLLASALPPALLACGGHKASPEPVDRVEIVPAGLLLPPGQGPVQLTGRALARDGRVLDRPVTFTSLAPSVVTVTAGGLASPVGSLGSAQLVASADGVSSAPALALVAAPVAGAVLVADGQVDGAPEPLDPPEAAGLGWRSRARLTGLAPLAVGDLVIGTGALPLGGRVVAVEPAGAAQLVTLAVVAPPELFERVVLDETFDLSAVEPVPSPEAAGLLTLRRQGARWQATLATAPEPPFGIPNVGPFSCALTAEVPLIEVTFPTARLDHALRLAIDYDSGRPSGERLRQVRVTGDLDGLVEAQVRLSPTGAIKLKCEALLYTIPVPVNGALAAVLGLNVPVGLGTELEESLSEDLGGWALRGSVKATIDMALTCPAGGGACQPSASTDATADGSVTPVLPPDDLDALTVKVTGSGYAIAKVAFGMPWVKALNMEAIELKAGVRSSVDYRAMAGQAADPAYHSSFVTEAYWEGEAASSFKALTDWLEIKWLAFKVGDATPLGDFPKGTVEVNPAVVPVGGSATVTVALESASYLGDPAVVRVDVVRQQALEGGGLALWPVCSATPSSPTQRVFTCQATFGADAAGPQVLRAFVLARDVATELSLEVDEDAKVSLVVGEPATAVFASTVAGVRFGPVHQDRAVSGPIPSCAGGEEYESRFYQYNASGGTWDGLSWTGAWGYTGVVTGIGSYHDQGTLSITLDATGQAITGFALHQQFDAIYDGTPTVTTAETLDLAWKGAPIPLAPPGQYIFQFSYLAQPPVDASTLDFADVITFSDTPCMNAEVSTTLNPGGWLLVGLMP